MIFFYKILMTTIIIKDGSPLPQKTFNTWEELRNVLNFMNIELQETKEAKALSDDIKNTPLTSFNYLTDESL